MSNMTKRALEESLKRLLLKKPLTKITINDLTTDCGISRMAFYYHFRDIYDLVEWVMPRRIHHEPCRVKKHTKHWQEGLLQIFEAVYENKPFIINAYHAVSREQIENYPFPASHMISLWVLYWSSQKKHALSDAQKNFIADFYKYSFVGIMLDWIRQGMKDDYASICDNMCTTIQGNIYKFHQKLYKIVSK